jgi:hypothetical protein
MRKASTKIFAAQTFRNLQDGTCKVVTIIIQSSNKFSWAPTASQSLLARHSNWRNAVIPEGSIMSKDQGCASQRNAQV